MVSLAVNIDAFIKTFGWPTVQSSSNCGKWIIMRFHKGVEKGDPTRLENVKLCLDEKQYKDLQAKKSDQAKEAAGEEKETEVEVKPEDATIIFHNYDKDAKDSDDLNKRVHKAFTEALVAAYKAKEAPVFGAVELWHKIVFVGYIPENCKMQLKMAAAGAKNNIKSTLNGIHHDVQATDAGELEFDEFIKFKPNI